MIFPWLLRKASWQFLALMLGMSAPAYAQTSTGGVVLEPPDSMRVIAQICLPNKVVFFENLEIDLTGQPPAKTMCEARRANGYACQDDKKLAAFPAGIAEESLAKDALRRWLLRGTPNEIKRDFVFTGAAQDHKGLRSYGTDLYKLTDSTDKNQPVYEQQSYPPQDILALNVQAEVEKDGKSQRVTYWFKLPDRIPSGEFSNWQSPLSEEQIDPNASSNRRAWWQLAQGAELPIYEVSESAPKMRYKLMSIRDYYDQNRFWRRVQAAVGQKYFKNLTAAERESTSFVRKSGAIIPGC